MNFKLLLSAAAARGRRCRWRACRIAMPALSAGLNSLKTLGPSSRQSSRRRTAGTAAAAGAWSVGTSMCGRRPRAVHDAQVLQNNWCGTSCRCHWN